MLNLNKPINEIINLARNSLFSNNYIHLSVHSWYDEENNILTRQQNILHRYCTTERAISTETYNKLKQLTDECSLKKSVDMKKSEIRLLGLVVKVSTKQECGDADIFNLTLVL